MKTRYLAGDYNVISDQSGQKYKRSECRLGVPGSIQAGLLVHIDEWSPRHPQLDIRPRPEHIAVKEGRPRQETQWAEGQGPNDEKIIFDDERAVFPQENGSFISTPDSEISSVTSDFSIVADLQVFGFNGETGLAIINKWAGFQTPTVIDLRSWALRLAIVAGETSIELDYTADGGPGSSFAVSSKIPVDISSRFKLGVYFNGPAFEVTFYIATEGNELELFGTEAEAAFSSIFDTSEPTRIGSRNVLTKPQPFNGNIFRAQVISGDITGPVLVDFNAEEYDFDTEPSTLISSTGETWTLNGNVTMERTQVI